MEYEALSVLAVSVAGIAAIVGLLVFLVKVAIPVDWRTLLFDEYPWVVNLVVIVLSIGVSLLGAWLNWEAFEMRAITEYVWRGIFATGVATLGYEGSKNTQRQIERG